MPTGTRGQEAPKIVRTTSLRCGRADKAVRPDGRRPARGVSVDEVLTFGLGLP